MPDQLFRSLEDLEKDKKKLIDEINESRNTAEKEISGIIGKLDYIVKESNRKISENIDNLNSYRKELEDSYIAKKTHIYSESQEKIGKFKEKESNIKAEFRNNNIIVIVVLGIPLIIFIITYISTYDTSTNTTSSSIFIYKLLFLFPLLVLIAVLILSFNLYTNVINKNNQIKKQSVGLNLESDNLNEETPVLKVTEVPQITESEKTSFKESKDILGSIVCSVGKSIPFIDSFYSEVTHLVKHRQLVNNFKLSLEFYNLVEDKKFFEEIGKYAPVETYIQNDEGLWEEIIVKKIFSQINNQKLIISENLILLLYSEHNGKPTITVFREIVCSEKEIQALASILIHSQKLTKSSDYEYKNEDIAAIIRNSDSYSLSNVNNMLSNLLINRRQLLKSFKLCLEFYKIIEDNKFFEEIGKYVSLDIYIKNDKNMWEEITAGKICSVCSQINMQETGQKFIFSENLLLLLYYEYNGEPTTSTFNKISHSEQEIQLLATVLIHSEKLTKSNDYEYKSKNIAAYNYKDEDIAAIIKQIKPFSLSSINDVLSDSFLTLKYLKSYVEFLTDNDIKISYEPTIEYIINKSKDISFEKRVVNLAYNLGLDNFKKINDLSEDFIDGFARASVTLKFHDDLSLRDEVCKCSSKDYSTAILWSYFEKIKENDGQKIVLISELINDKEKVTFFLNKLEDPDLKDLKFFQTQLKDGQWYDSSFSLLRKFFDESRKEIGKELSNFKEKLSNLEDYEILKDSIQSNFLEVSIGTIEKLIDAQYFGAYVIMFNSGKSQNSDKSNEGKIDEAKKNEEKLRKIIDNLSKRDLDQSGDNKWKFREEEKIIKELKHTCGLRPKYDFINFSHSTRIGILDKDQSFQDFKNEFLDDVRTILSSKDEKFNVGVVVLKIMPSNYSFGTLDNDGTPDNIQIKELNAVKYIARLAGTKLPLEDQVSAMRFEKNIDLLEIVNKQSFYEIVRNRNDDIINKKEIKILDEPELTKDILYELNEKKSIENFRSLALDLKEGLYGKEDIDKISEVIESVLKERYLNEDGLKRKANDRPRILSQRFINSLTNLASLYKLQRGN